jgi:hypothetical protein
VKYGEPMRFEKLRAEAKNCSKPRLKEIYQEVADEIMAAIAKLEPKARLKDFPNGHPHKLILVLKMNWGRD